MKFNRFISVVLCIAVILSMGSVAFASNSFVSGKDNDENVVTITDYSIQNSNSNSRNIVIVLEAKQLSTITYTPQEQTGYQFSNFTVIDKDNNLVSYQKLNDTDYSICLPVGKNTITVFYVKNKVPTMSFSDVSPKAWCYNAVKYVYTNGIMNGTVKTSFSPDTNVSRGMFVTMIYRLENEPIASELYGQDSRGSYVADGKGQYHYYDISKSDYYCHPALWATNNKIILGVGNDLFRPSANLTREQIVTILYRYAQLKNKAMQLINTNTVLDYADGNRVATYAREAVNWAIETGMLQGSSDGYLNPTAAITRAECAVIIQRYLTSTK